MSSRDLLLPAALLACLMGCNQTPSETAIQRPSPNAVSSVRPVNDRPLLEPYATESVRNRSTVIERPDGAQLHLPEGFQVREYTPDFTFQRPRFMLLGPSNEVLVSDSHDEGGVYVLQDTNQDGVADKRSTLLEDMYRPYGIAFWEDYVYVAGTTEIKRWKYDPSTMTVSGQGETVVSWPQFDREAIGPGPSYSIRRALKCLSASDPHPMWMPVEIPVGQPSMFTILTARDMSFMQKDYAMRWAWIFIPVHPGDLGLGSGTRCSWVTTWFPIFSPRCTKANFFGWPYAYIGPHEDPRRQGERPELVEMTRYPDVLFPAHCGVLDIEFYTGLILSGKIPGRRVSGLPRILEPLPRRIGYRVDFVPFKDGQPASGTRGISQRLDVGPGRSKRSGADPSGSFNCPTVHF